VIEEAVNGPNGSNENDISRVVALMSVPSKMKPPPLNPNVSHGLSLKNESELV
jgi:hypothetical protein